MSYHKLADEVMREACLSGIRTYWFHQVIDYVVKSVNEDEGMFSVKKIINRKEVDWTIGFGFESVSTRDQEWLAEGAKFQQVRGGRVYKNGHREELSYLVFYPHIEDRA